MNETVDILMNETYDRIALEIIELWRQAEALGKNQILIGFAGCPGSGKSSTVQQLSKRIPCSIILPMDGYHYTKRQLQAFADPNEAFKRRGAHWTFDGKAFVCDLANLKSDGEGSFPSFDHAIGDPIYNDINITSVDHIVLVEGNYLLLDVSPWDAVKDILDFSYFISCDIPIVEKRVYLRHISVGCSPL
jgi:pantothenate kinase